MPGDWQYRAVPSGVVCGIEHLNCAQCNLGAKSNYMEFKMQFPNCTLINYTLPNFKLIKINKLI